jgi:hypothetical protein
MLHERGRQVAIAANGNDLDTFGGEIATPATREGLDRATVTRPFDQHDCTRLHAFMRAGGAGLEHGSARDRTGACPAAGS